MIQYVRKLIQKLPAAYGNYIKFDCLIGLRPSEAVEAVKLINDREKFQKYYKPERMALEHFHFTGYSLDKQKKRILRL